MFEILGIAGGIKGFLLNFFVFAVSLFVLIRGADMLIDGAVSLARHLRVSDFVIGLIVVAFGTSFPEFVVSVVAQLKGEGEVAISNVIGSNIANILLGLGIASVIIPLKAQRNFVIREIPANFLITLILFFAVNSFGASFIPTPEEISRAEGFILLTTFAFYLYVIAMMREKAEDLGEGWEEEEEKRIMPLPKAGVFIILGILGIGFGGNFAVDSALSVVRILGLSDTFAGIFFIAVGTSLPEFVTSVVASVKKNPDIIIGNIAGSNIFNIAWVLGFVSVIKPVPIPGTVNFHFFFLVVANFLLLFSMFFGKRRIITRGEGIAFLILYSVYIALSVIFERV